jgi:primosomal protein N' (replication factor Y)
LDYRKVIEVFSKNFNIKLILGDILLKIETIYSVKNDYFGELSPLKFRYITGTNCQIDFFGKQTSSKKIEIFTEKSKNILNETLHKNKHIFVYTTRKGLALNIFCADCGKNVVCNNCGAPVSLYENKKDKEDNFFMCNRCRTKRSALEKCQKCNSWKLIPFGFGTEAVLNEIKSITETPVYIIEKDSVKTVKKALQIVGDFYKSSKAILLGTNMAISYLNKPVDNSIVTSLDGLLTMPDFRINEKIMKDVLNIREITEENLLVQTRQSEFKILEYATRANIADFYKEEIKEREEFEYPPFSIFIKISLLGSKNIIRKEMEKLKEELSDYDMFIFDGNYLTPKKEHIVSGLIKVKKEKWPDENLTKKLKQLPPQYIIKIDPDNIL